MTPVKVADESNGCHQQGMDRSSDFGFNSPMYTPNTAGKYLSRIKECSYENTPLSEFKSQFAQKIKSLRQHLKENNLRSPEMVVVFDGTPMKEISVSSAAPVTVACPSKTTSTTIHFAEVLATAVERLPIVKPIHYWQTLFQLADFAKKDCLYHEAKYFYKMAISLQPFCSDVRRCEDGSMIDIP